MKDIIGQLYSGEWKSSVQKASEIVDRTDAEHLVRELTLSSGWRERVSAAKIACAFELRELVPALVHTFAVNPETYTASAFSRLLVELRPPQHDALLRELRGMCPPNSYGEHLLELIENAERET